MPELAVAPTLPRKLPPVPLQRLDNIPYLHATPGDLANRLTLLLWDLLHAIGEVLS